MLLNEYRLFNDLNPMYYVNILRISDVIDGTQEGYIKTMLKEGNFYHFSD